MKATNTSSIELRKKAIEFDNIDLFQILAITLLVSLISILLYKNLYLWSIGVILASFGVIKIYRLYKNLIDADWSIDLSNVAMEDVITDLEDNYYTK